MTSGETFGGPAAVASPAAISVRGFAAGREGFWRRILRKRKDRPTWVNVVIILLVVFFLLVVVRSFVFSAYLVASGSMENTVQPGDRVLVNKMVYDFRDPARGEVVVFNDPGWSAENYSDTNASLFSRLGSGFGDLIGVGDMGSHEFIKRVIGVPGDYVACCDVDGNITVNGASIDEPYVTLNAPIADASTASNQCGSVTVRNFRTVTVPPGELFVLGDHRLVSEDSRCAGMVPISDVVGKAEAIVWPASRWTDLSSIPAAFRNVPAPSAAGEPQSARVDEGVSGGAVVALPLLAVAGLAGRRGRTCGRARPRRWGCCRGARPDVWPGAS